MSLWVMYYELTAVDIILLLLFIVFLSWSLHLYTRNTTHLQAKLESENATEGQISPRDQRRDVINGSKKKERHCESGNSRKQTKDFTPIKMQEKQCGKMLDKHHRCIQSNLVYLINEIEDPIPLCLSLFTCGVFDRDDVRKIRKTLKNENSKDATETLIFTLLSSGRNAYQPFLECLDELGYYDAIERLQQTQGEPSNQQSGELRLIEERGALLERVNEKLKTLEEVLKEKGHDVQRLEIDNKHIIAKLGQLRNEMDKIENDKQSEKGEREQELCRLRARENELLKNHEEVKAQQQRNHSQIKNLESRVDDLKAATIIGDNEFPKLKSDITNLFMALKTSATAEYELRNKMTKMENEKQSEKDDIVQEISRLRARENELLKNHGEQKQTILSQIKNLESRVEGLTAASISRDNDLSKLQSDITNLYKLLEKSARTEDGADRKRKNFTRSKKRTHFSNLDDACLRGDLYNLRRLIDSGHDIRKRFRGGMTPLLFCSQSEIEPVSKMKMILDKGANIYDTDTDKNNVLHLACGYSHLATVEYLLNLGLFVNSGGFKDKTPILCSSESLIEPVSKIKMILDRGGNIYDRDTENNNILHLACKWGSLETVDYLLQVKGLDVMSRNKSGRTPLDCCRSSSIQSDEKIQLFEDKMQLSGKYYSPFFGFFN